MLATYMRRMRNNNLKIRIAGSSCRPQIAFGSFSKDGFPPLRNFYVGTRVNKIETMCERPLVIVKFERGFTFMFTCDLP